MLALESLYIPSKAMRNMISYCNRQESADIVNTHLELDWVCFPGGIVVC